MDAIQACDIVVATLKSSRLNFFLQESPFSITVNIKKTFIKNQAGSEIYPDVEDFSCIKCKMSVSNQVVKNTTGEIDDKDCDLKDTIQDLSIKLDKAKIELSEVMTEKNTLLAGFRDITEKFQGELKKKDEAFIKELKKSEILSENLLLAEAQLENLKCEEKKLFYNVETNNNFEMLDIHEKNWIPKILRTKVRYRKQKLIIPTTKNILKISSKTSKRILRMTPSILKQL